MTESQALAALRTLMTQAQLQPQDPAIPTLAEAFARPKEQIAWRVESHIKMDGFCSIVAKPKVGKSTLARGLALAVSRGEPWLGFRTVQSNVLYLGLEDRFESVREHFALMGATGEEPLRFFDTTQDKPDDLMGLIRKYKLGLVVIDPIFDYLTVASVNDYAEVNTALKAIQHVARVTRCTIIFTHHAAKGEERDDVDSSIGTTAIAGSVDEQFNLNQGREDDLRTIRKKVSRYGAPMSETCLRLKSDGTMELAGSKFEAEMSKLKENILKVLAMGSALHSKEIFEQIEGNEHLRSQALSDLVKHEQVERITLTRGEGVVYSLPSREPEEFIKQVVDLFPGSQVKSAT